MRKILLLSVLCATLFGNESTSNAFPYVDVGFGFLPVPSPIVGMGARFQRKHIGLDLSLQAATIIVLTALKENINFIFYPEPDLSSQLYVGVGLGAFEVIDSHGHIRGFLSPQLLIGKEYVNENGSRHYLQGRIDCPLIRQDWMTSHKYRHGSQKFLASVIFSYGFCF